MGVLISTDACTPSKSLDNDVDVNSLKLSVHADIYRSAFTILYSNV